jgi:hypothetical protein
LLKPTQLNLARSSAPNPQGSAKRHPDHESGAGGENAKVSRRDHFEVPGKPSREGDRLGDDDKLKG